MVRSRVPADWTSDIKGTGAVGWQSAAWYDRVAGCGGPKPTTTTCWQGSGGQTQFSSKPIIWRVCVSTVR